MNSHRADVTVIIPAYNTAPLLPRCIESVLAQTVLPVEILVIDDGSSDNVEEVVHRYSPDVQYIRRPNGGCGAARNTGIKMARGKWIALIDADDRWLPQKLELQLACAASFPAAALIYCDAMLCDRDGAVSGNFLAGRDPVQGQAFDRLLEWSFVLPSTAMMQREAIVEAGYFNESLRYVEDYDLWIRLARKHEFRAVPAPLVLYERQENSISQNKAAMARSEIQQLKNLLKSGLSAPQCRKVRRRMARHLFDLGYEIRKTNRKESVAVAWDALCLQPWRIRNWTLVMKNIGWMASSIRMEP